MPKTLLLVIALSLPVLTPTAAEEPSRPNPDTLLVLKNGAEVRGAFVEMAAQQYVLRLQDGRLMTYSASDVESVKRLAPDESTPAPAARATAVPPTTPFTCNLFLTEKDLDKTLYTALKDVKVSKKWYGSTNEMYDDLAEKARKAGADGVIRVRTWHAPSGFSWAAPHAGGTAIKWTPAGRTALRTLEGRCY